MDYDMPDCSETDLTTLSRTFIAAVAYLPPLTDDMLIDQATAISASSETTTKPQGRLRGPKKKKPSAADVVWRSEVRDGDVGDHSNNFSLQLYMSDARAPAMNVRMAPEV